MDKTTLFKKKAIASVCLVMISFLHAQNATPTDLDDFARVRIGFNSANGFHRQLLLGFMNEFATSDFDPGYDAVQIDNQPSDMYFMLGGLRLVIQGVGAFEDQFVFPLEVKTALSGTIGFTLDATENFSPDQPIYIHDALTNEYHNIRNGAVQIPMTVGTTGRFSLRFALPPPLSATRYDTVDGIIVRYANKEQLLHIRNHSPNHAINSVEVYNIQGQRLTSWIVKDPLQEQFPMNPRLGNGTYLIKVQATDGDVNKKILVENE